ncbi:molybdopterin-dependent oxidoreductase [Actinoplanes siamensis]|uniref:Molybdopterin-binding protein n=1 Tax=Actinoplanes siamensis TaxID=1223317 RepID=A0A919KDJ5_9ACTN|nr:molybdopterin-dependent oxidoreductase [Actinoplanes siamensis]GIF02612.1 molybdopterin-binding protein [Actinoplanes siamensis]
MVRHPDSRARRVLTWLTRPLPPPPERLRRGPLRAGAFDPAPRAGGLVAPPGADGSGSSPSGGSGSPLRSTRLTSQLGVALGVAFGICFLTGLYSHLLQHPAGWLPLPERPAGLYRVTQGLHVATGLAAVPLLGVKLWSVYPRLFTWPPVRDPAHAAARLSVAALVGAALFQLVSGMLNIAHWYGPMPFFFTNAHYWVAWLAAGALTSHVGVQLPVIREALRGRAATGRAGTPESGDATRSAAGRSETPAGGDAAPDRSGTPGGREAAAGRRELLLAVSLAAGVITVATLGQTVRFLSPVSLLAPRRPGTGPQGLPVNRTAAAAGVRAAALDPGYRLTVTGLGRTVELSLADLAALPQHTTVLPIACVEGWSSVGTWTGVRLMDLLRLIDADPGECTAEVRSLQAGGRHRTSKVGNPADERTLVALRLGGEPLALDHGYPARLIAPNRPGVQQTKWIRTIAVRRAS